MDAVINAVSTSKKPRLTIALGVYNDAHFLPGTFDRLLSQTYTDFELIVADNASTDESPQIIEHYARKDPRIRVIHQPVNVGMVRNYNMLIKQGVGEYFMWAACDDQCAPKFVETIMNGMEKDPSIVLGFTPYQFMNENDETYGSIRNFDYSGKTAFIRLWRFITTSYDDCMTYGIYRSEVINEIEFPVWWWLNKNTPLNAAYALLVFILSRGDVRIFGTEPLWFNYIKTNAHYEPFRRKQSNLLFLLFYILRKINLVCIQFKNIWRGSNTILLAIVFFPLLVLRALADLYILVYRAIRRRVIKKTVQTPA